MRIAFAILFSLLSIVAVMFLVRILCAPFSERIASQMRQHRKMHVLWGGLTAIFVLLYLVQFNPGWWPPAFIERRAQRQKVFERIETIGGWEALQKSSEELVAHQGDGFVFWRGKDTNALPPALTKLAIRDIRIYTANVTTGSGTSPVRVVRLKFFGLPSSGGRATPYFGLDITTRTNVAGFRPMSGQGVPGNRHHRFRQITEMIYEIY